MNEGHRYSFINNRVSSKSWNKTKSSVLMLGILFIELIFSVMSFIRQKTFLLWEKNMKNKLVSLILLSILLIGIVQATSTKGALEQDDNTFNDQYDEYFSNSEFKPEIQPVDSLENPSVPTFSPSPVSFNNMTPKVNMKTVEVEEQRLIIQIDLEKQIVQKGESLKYTIQATKGFEPASGEKLIVEIIEGEYWGWYHYYYYRVMDYNDRTITRKPITTDSDGLYNGEFTFSR